ncbi:glycosyl hydrolase family 47, partial [Opisthorchis viverrini]
MKQLIYVWLLCHFVTVRSKNVDLNNLKNRVKELFYHAYDGYMRYAYPLDELRPLTCDGHNTWGSFSLTLVDALDTLAIVGNWSEFRRAGQMLLDHLDTSRNVNVSVFETNIRVIGGLLSAHLLSRRAGFRVEPSWPCSGPLLRQAEVLANKLLPAFDTPTGMPYGTVNLATNGVPPKETPVTCAAGIGTLILEFGTLSRLTGDPRFEKVAMNALRSIWKYRSALGLLGNHIDVQTGRWTATESTIGAGVDSLFEYLVKGAALFRLPELDAMFREYKRSIDAYLRHNDWHLLVNKDSGRVTKPIFQGLDAFWPAVLSLTGDLDGALRHVTAYHEVWKQYGFIPESYNVVTREAVVKQESYHLRPEFIESVYYLYRATKDPLFIQMGVDVLTSIELVTKTRCGFATVVNVTTHELDNRMESFFLSETTKYLYLLFDEDNFINELPGDRPVSRPHISPSGNQCYPELGGYIFNTEAHPIDPGALNCCFANNLDDSLSSVEDPLAEESLAIPTPDLMEELEALRIKENEFNPLDQLLALIDSASQGSSHTDPDQSGESIYSYTDENPAERDLYEPWTELRDMVLSVISSPPPTAIPSNRSFEVPVFDDLHSIRPQLLTCPSPPFHQRYTIGGQLVNFAN